MMSSLILAVLICLLNITVFADQLAPSSDGEVQQSTRWGLEDRATPVGRLFQYKLNGEISGSIEKVI
jgi:hypothetical protein